MRTITDYSIINVDKEILGGTPVFKGTRVPVKTLFDYLEGNYTLEEFLNDFPTVKKTQVSKLLKNAEKFLVA